MHRASFLLEPNLIICSRIEQQRKVKAEKTEDTIKGMNVKGAREGTKKNLELEILSLQIGTSREKSGWVKATG